MSEIEKLYKNAGVEKQKYYACKRPDYSDVFEEKLPPFTAEKQLELIKWLAKKKFVAYNNSGGWFIGIIPTYSEELGIVCKNKAMNIDSFDEALAGLINNLWQNLSLEEKQQIKEILSD